MSGIPPYRSRDTLYAGANGALHVIRGLNLNLVGAAALFPTQQGDTAYTIGSAQIVMVDGVGSLVAKTCVSNEMNGAQPSSSSIKSHPDDLGALYGADMITPGMKLTHAWFGVRVTTALGSELCADVWIAMKPGAVMP